MGPDIRPIAPGTVRSETRTPSEGKNSGFRPLLEQQLTVSRHAVSRLQQRHQHLTPAEWQQLADATDAAGKSGAKQAAIVMPKGIFIVAPPTRTVITAIDRTNQPMQLVSQVDALVLVGRTDKTNPEAPPSRPTDGGSTQTPMHWSLINPQEL